jgi:hypothetical protein
MLELNVGRMGEAEINATCTPSGLSPSLTAGQPVRSARNAGAASVGSVGAVVWWFLFFEVADVLWGLPETLLPRAQPLLCFWCLLEGQPSIPLAQQSS